MSPIAGFLSFLTLTLACLGSAVYSGLRARRKLHFFSVGGAVAALAATIYYAEAMGETLDLDSAGRIYPIHISIAKLATLAYLLPVLSGLRTLKEPAFRKVHGRIALAVLVLTVLTAVTGIWMVLAAGPLSE